MYKFEEMEVSELRAALSGPHGNTYGMKIAREALRRLTMIGEYTKSLQEKGGVQ